MEPHVLALILGAAVLHAVWNAFVKAGADRLATMAMVNIGGAAIALPFAFLLPFPDPAALPYLAAAVCVHTFYFAGLVFSYSHGDLSHVYPVARGLGPLVVTGLTILTGAETLTPAGVAAVALTSLGITSLAFDRGLGGGARPLAFALLTGVAIGCYTFLDGLGARAAGNPHSYVIAVFVLNGILPVLLLATLRRRRVLRTVRLVGWQGPLGGLLSLGAYWLVVWAMSFTTLAHVAALRETSVIIAAVIGARLLGEASGARRVASAGVVAAGIVLLQIAG